MSLEDEVEPGRAGPGDGRVGERMAALEWGADCGPGTGAPWDISA